MEMKQKRINATSQPLSRITFDKLICRFARTLAPAAMSPRNTRTSSGLPSSTVASPNVGTPKIPSHFDTGLVVMINIQTIGIQRALVTFGLSRKSRQKSQLMNPMVRVDATMGGILKKQRYFSVRLP